MTDQMNHVVALYHRTNLEDEGERKVLADSIQETSLPQFHKQVLLVQFLSRTADEAILGTDLLRQQEILRHQDSMTKIVSKATTERLKRAEAAGSA